MKKGKMKKQIRILSVSNSPKFIESLLAFHYEDSILCPKEQIWDYKKKDSYTEQELMILDVIGSLKRSRMMCPIVCSGNRGDGSKYARKCIFFKGYGKEKENVWNFRNPKSFIFCSKSENGMLKVRKIVSPWCYRKRLAVEVARNLDLIHRFGSSCLEKTLLQECLKCNYKRKDGCNYKVGCEKGKIIFAFECKVGICEICKERRNL